MASNEARIRQLVADNLEIDGQPVNLPSDLDVSLTELGVSSMDVVSFAKVVSQEFNITFTPEDCVNLKTPEGTLGAPRKPGCLTPSASAALATRTRIGRRKQAAGRYVATRCDAALCQSKHSQARRALSVRAAGPVSLSHGVKPRSPPGGRARPVRNRRPCRRCPFLRGPRTR